MVYFKNLLLLAFVAFATHSNAQTSKFKWEEVKTNYANQKIPFSIPYTANNLEFLHKKGVNLKAITKDFILFSASPEFIDASYKSGDINDFYLEFSNPTALDDTARAILYVDQVHQGIAPLEDGYTGEGVIMAFIDEGLDFNHDDFKDANGNSRVIRYWDQGAGQGPTTPGLYGYGQICDSASINDGTCPFSEENSAHGTTVTGIGAGDGSANGSNMGMAPDTKIIFIESDFSLPNWTLTIADACDYIFKVADSLGKPAVVNLSLGSYLGSHDGNDPAAEMMEQLIDQKGGRLIVCAAGNSGGIGNYHVRNDITTDTSFIWLKNNPNGAGGQNTILFDLWSDMTNANYQYSYGADRQDYSFVGSTTFRSATASIGTPVFDTIYNQSGEKIASITTYTETVGGALHIQGYFESVDSTAYNFRFMTKGNGRYDLWSTATFGLSNIVQNIPSNTVMPFIDNYVLPDANQSIVSSWNCSEKVISVGNVLNRLHHIDFNGNTYNAGGNPAVSGVLSGASSKGPSRLDVIKPDVSATGDVTLAAAPNWLLNNASYNTLIDSGGYHARNGGTSMASPCVAGIGALLLEKCYNLDYEDFKAALFANATTGSYMGSLPNNSYGYGIANAHTAASSTNFVANLLGDTVICANPAIVFPEGNPLYVEWYDNSNQLFKPINAPENEIYATLVIDERGCSGKSDTVEVVQGTPATPITISLSGNVLTASQAPNYQWFIDGQEISGEVNQTTLLNDEGTYMVVTYSGDGCSEFDTLRYFLGLEEDMDNLFSAYPNPTHDKFNVTHEGNQAFLCVLMDVEGRQLRSYASKNGEEIQIDMSTLSKGVYLCNLVLNNKTYTIKVMKE